MSLRLFNLTILLLFCTASVAIPLQPQALDIAGVYKISDFDPNLTGKNVNIGLVCRSETYNDLTPQNDYRPDTSHNCFKELNANFYDDQPEDAGISAHSTAIASILAGFDTNSSSAGMDDFSYEGACPRAALDIYEFRHFLAEYVFSGAKPDVDLLTMSLGWALEDWWTRGIDKMAESNGLLVIASIGNGKMAYDLPLFPAAGANVLAVGVLNSKGSLSDFNTPDVHHSTAGPTLDGRCKPDIVAPGNCLVALAGTKDDFISCGDYSSFAAPVVAGVSSLLIQKAKSEPNLQFAISPFSGNCVLKSILMTSAKKLQGWHKGFMRTDDDSEYPLDFKQGAGMIDGFTAFNILTAGMQQDGNIAPTGWDAGVIEPDYTTQKVYRFKTDGFEKPFVAITVVWNRSYENEYPFAPLLKSWADLQIQLLAVDSNSAGCLVDSSNSPVDNVEHIYTSLDPNSEYEFIISNSQNSDLPDSFVPYAVSWLIKEKDSE